MNLVGSSHSIGQNLYPQRWVFLRLFNFWKGRHLENFSKENQTWDYDTQEDTFGAQENFTEPLEILMQKQLYNMYAINAYNKPL